jgi:signal transduction histidine kinase
VNDLPAPVGGQDGGNAIQAFGRMANEFGLAGLVTAGTTESAPVVFMSSALAAWLGRDAASVAGISLASVLGEYTESSKGTHLCHARLKHALGHRLPVLISRNPFKEAEGSFAWICFEAQPEPKKLASLAQQLAHELNNPLTSVLWKLDLVGRQLPTVINEPTRIAELISCLEEAHFGTSRAVDLVREFAKSVDCRVDYTRATDLIEVIQSALYLSHAEIEQVATLVREFSRVPLVYGDPSRLQQVFSNLLMNALQAVREASLAQDHRIRIAVRYEPPWVVASVDDTGIGISDELSARIFEPFVTTRATSGGSGLGLFICREIVDSLGGRLEVRSSRRSGSSFRVLLRSAADQPRAGSRRP